jgi:hypothetical protein
VGSEQPEPDYGLMITNSAMDLLRGLLAGGCLNRAGLLHLHGLLAPETTTGRAWVPCPALDLVRLEAADELAANFGVRPEDLPGREPTPSTPADLLPPEQRPW